MIEPSCSQLNMNLSREWMNQIFYIPILYQLHQPLYYSPLFLFLPQHLLLIEMKVLKFLLKNRKYSPWDLQLVEFYFCLVSIPTREHFRELKFIFVFELNIFSTLLKLNIQHSYYWVQTTFLCSQWKSVLAVINQTNSKFLLSA